MKFRWFKILLLQKPECVLLSINNWQKTMGVNPKVNANDKYDKEKWVNRLRKCSERMSVGISTL